MRASAAWILIACIACASPTEQSESDTTVDLAKLDEDAQLQGTQWQATHARQAWEAAKQTERLAQGQFQAGVIPEAELSAATGARLRAERDLAIRDLAVDEVALSGRSPDRHLDAPPIDDQDFVLRWLEIEEVYAARIRDNLIHHHDIVNQLYKMGLAPFDAVLPLDGAAAVARVEHQRWRDLAALRRRMTANAIGPKRSYDQAAETIYSADVEMARIRVRTANRIVKLLAEHHSQGLCTASEVAAAQSELLRLQNALHEAEMGRGPALDQFAR